jgi:hypothetical protein
MVKIVATPFLRYDRVYPMECDPVERFFRATRVARHRLYVRRSAAGGQFEGGPDDLRSDRDPRYEPRCGHRSSSRPRRRFLLAARSGYGTRADAGGSRAGAIAHASRAPRTKDAAGKNAAKKPADAKKESVPNAAPAGLRRPRAGLDGASRPPLPVGANAR